MNLEKLFRKLKRDLAANPKRAALLGLMLLVAGYFWAPLLNKWLGNGRRKATAVAVPAVVGNETPAAVVETAKSQPRWDTLLSWMEADSRMNSGKLPENIQPFGRRQVVAGETEQEPVVEPETTPPAIADVSPQAAGVVLNGVLVGSKQQLATLNGEAYRVGETIVIASKDSPQKLEYRLLAVDKEGVLLGRGQKRYEMKLERTKLVGRDKIERLTE